jgi:hypothetical protein
MSNTITPTVFYRTLNVEGTSSPLRSKGGGGWDSASEAQIESLKRAASRLRGLCGRINL